MNMITCPYIQDEYCSSIFSVLPFNLSPKILIKCKGKRRGIQAIHPYIYTVYIYKTFYWRHPSNLPAEAHLQAVAFPRGGILGKLPGIQKERQVSRVNESERERGRAGRTGGRRGKHGVQAVYVFRECIFLFVYKKVRREYDQVWSER